MKKIENKTITAPLDIVVKAYYEKNQPGWKLERFRITASYPPQVEFDGYRLTAVKEDEN